MIVWVDVWTDVWIDVWTDVQTAKGLYMQPFLGHRFDPRPQHTKAVKKWY